MLYPTELRALRLMVGYRWSPSSPRASRRPAPEVLLRHRVHQLHSPAQGTPVINAGRAPIADGVPLPAGYVRGGSELRRVRFSQHVPTPLRHVETPEDSIPEGPILIATGSASAGR